MKPYYLIPVLALSAAVSSLPAQTPPPPAAPDTAAAPAKSPGKPVDPEKIAKKRVAIMTQALGLTPDQAEKITAIQTQAFPEFQQIKADTSLTPEQKRQKLKTLRKGTDEKIAGVLTPEQKTQWAEQRKKMKQAHPKASAAPSPAPQN